MEPTFGERLTSWLKFVKIRPASLARALEVSRTAVHGWMHDGSSPTTDRIAPICTAMGVSVAEFFARMPSEEAKDPLPDEEDELGPHPTTGDVTLERRFDLSDEACPTCGHRTEAA